MANQLNTTNPSRRAILTGIPAAAIGVGALSASVTAAQATESPDAELIALGHQLTAAWEAETAAFSVVGDDEERWAKAEKLFAITSAIVRRIEDMPARTVAGLRVKAMAASWTQAGEEFTPEVPCGTRSVPTTKRLARSIIRDLLALNI